MLTAEHGMGSFSIQASSPFPIRSYVSDVETLSGAAQEVFSICTERAFLIWNSLYIPIDYKYDLGHFLQVIMDMLEHLALDSGEREIVWFSDTFFSRWNIAWNRSEDSLSIDAVWETVPGGLKPMLATQGTLNLSLGEFIAEWKRPMQIVFSAVTEAGYTPTQIPELERLEAILSRIASEGVLYSKSSKEAWS